jgi:hypothetical protein
MNKKKIAIMQPYFFPYIGYFQLINAVDEFVIYDNIEYTKKGWINRNRILVNGKDDYITLPIKKDSDYLHIKDRFLSDTWLIERNKMINRITESYRRAPFFGETFKLIESCIMIEEKNLYNFIYHSVQALINYLGINTKITVSSSLSINHNLKAEDKVLAICKEQQADVYINPIGGVGLYEKEIFHSHNLELNFQRSNTINYKQFNNEFVPFLSIVDVLMFNSTLKIKEYLEDFELI